MRRPWKKDTRRYVPFSIIILHKNTSLFYPFREREGEEGEEGEREGEQEEERKRGMGREGGREEGGEEELHTLSR